jgi:transposase
LKDTTLAQYRAKADRRLDRLLAMPERALRPSVIFRKVTNGFRSIWGADVHALTRSVIGTGCLNRCTAFQAISKALQGLPILAS